MQVDIAVGGDEGYAWGIAATLRSAARWTPGPIRITVLDLGLAPATRARLQRVAAGWPNVKSVQVLSPDLTHFSGLPTPAHLTVATYARLLLPELLPDVGTVLYLDADVLVRRDLTPLVVEAMESGAPAAAVLDQSFPTLSTGLPQEALRVGAHSTAPFYNCGVLVLDLAQWRRDGLASKVEAWLRAHPSEVRFADQDGINAVLGTMIYQVSPAWNVQTAPVHTLLRNPDDPRRGQVGLPVEQLLQDARVVHFIGGKPWNGQGVQANAMSVRANAEWWRTASTSGLGNMAAVVRIGSHALRLGVPHAMRLLARGRGRACTQWLRRRGGRG